MMSFLLLLFWWVLALLAMSLVVVGDDVKVAAADSNCPTINHYVAPMHQNTACDIVAFNQYKKSLVRFSTYKRLQTSGTQNVPDQKTTYCPSVVEPLTSSNSQMGFDSSWVIENTASVSVAVAFLKERTDGSFVEVSALDNTIAPANHDPNAILKPGEWKGIQGHEGNVFHMREILQDGSMGRILLQHRMGMIPITNKYGHDLQCDPTETDLEPLVVKKDEVPERDPDYARRMAPELRLCNVYDIGFRNRVGCPVNGYYTGHYATKGLVRPRGNVTQWKEQLRNTPKSCYERFELHLGLNERPHDFMWDWDSTTKYESAHIGQNFVFRLAQDERVVVDSFSLHTTKVIDCPGLKNQVNAVSLPYGQAVVEPIGPRVAGRYPLNYVLAVNGTSPWMNVTASIHPPAGMSATRRNSAARHFSV